MCLSKHVILSTRIGGIRVGMFGIRESVYVSQTAQTGCRGGRTALNFANY